MNAHADMLIVVGTTDITYQWAFIALLFRVCEILQDFVIPKQAPINAFYYVCKLSFALQNYNISLNNARKIIKKSEQPYQIFRKGATTGLPRISEW